MKTKIFLGLVMICFLLGSCFDDESSKNVEFLKPIQINDFSTSMELYVSQGGRLKIKTLAYKEGMDDAHYRSNGNFRDTGNMKRWEIR